MLDTLLTMIEDVTTILDDVAVLSKVAAKKTAGVVGDDLALNAEQVSGVRADRELHVVWQVAKGSLLNKVILVPIALTLSAVAPWLIAPLLVLGGLYLCFEGVEKVWHKLFHAPQEKTVEERLSQQLDPLEREKEKIKGAIRTDFVLSAEIIVIALGTMGDVTFEKRVLTLAVVALGMTVSVYGLVAGIVKIDDAGLHMLKSPSGVVRSFGRVILAGAPWLMRGLGIVGTIAMFLVGGSIVMHAVHVVDAWTTGISLRQTAVLAWLIRSGAELCVGVLAGLVSLGIVNVGRAILGRKT